MVIIHLDENERRHFVLIRQQLYGSKTRLFVIFLFLLLISDCHWNQPFLIRPSSNLGKPWILTLSLRVLCSVEDHPSQKYGSNSHEHWFGGIKISSPICTLPYYWENWPISQPRTTELFAFLSALRSPVIKTNVIMTVPLTSDLAIERNILMKQAYPKLKVHCREKYGYEFQVQMTSVIASWIGRFVRWMYDWDYDQVQWNRLAAITC